MNKEQEKSFCVTLTDKNVTHSQNTVLDAMCYALGFPTLEDAMDQGYDYLVDVAREAYRAFDWKGCMRDKMNASPDMNSDPRIKDSPYLAGDWFEKNEPEFFQGLIKDAKERAEKELWDVCPFNEDATGVPEKLMESIRKEVGWCEESTYNEWLHGDRSQDGVLDLISKKLTGERGNVGIRERDNFLDKVLVTFTEDQARDFIGYNLDEREPVTLELLTKDVERYIYNKYNEEGERRKARYEKRKADQARREERSKKEEEARDAAARARKQQALIDNTVT